MAQLILIVEDEPKLASLLKDYLQQSSFRTHTIDEGESVVEWIVNNKPDLILLDLMLPGKDGISICKEIRAFSELPIIMITAKVEEIDRLLGLELGADDYICKPFSPREVVARVKTVLRRSRQIISEPQSAEQPVLVLNRQRYTVTWNQCELDLTSVEFELLNTMNEYPGRIFSRDQLMDRIYSDQRIVSGRTIDSHIKKLRKKLCSLQGDKQDKEWIVSVYGVGYKIEFD